MSMQMYIVTFKGGFNQQASRSLQQHVHHLGGFILMVTNNGPLIAIDDAKAAAVAQHSSVAFIGGVTFNPRGLAAESLQRIFADNLSKQVIVQEATARAPEKS